MAEDIRSNLPLFGFRQCDRGHGEVPARSGRVLSSSFKQVSPLDQGAHLAVYYSSLQHPKTAVGMDIPQPPRPQRLHDHLNAGGDELWAFYLVVLDVDQPDAQGNPRIKIG